VTPLLLQARSRATLRLLALAAALAVGCGCVYGQKDGQKDGKTDGHAFNYVEPGLAACPAVPATGAPKAVPRGVAVPGRIVVACGLNQGSYTVTLSSSDPGATFAPKTFIVNFGRVMGTGVFAVTFATVGAQRVSAAITSNMGSPAVQGYFASPVSGFDVVLP
jgi:hypothetical protein